MRASSAPDSKSTFGPSTAMRSSSVASGSLAAKSSIAAKTAVRNVVTRARTAGEAIPFASKSLRASHERQRLVVMRQA
jgi:hypothetical protein